MPINPEIALQVQTPPAPDMLGSLAKVLGIKNAIAQQQLIPGQQQLQQQQIQGAQLENQQRQNDVNEYQGFKDALAKHNGDYEAATPDILSAAPKLGTSFIKTLTENKKNIAETTKANADAQHAQLEAADLQNKTITQTLQGIDQVPPENQQTEYLHRLAILHAAGVPTDKMPLQYDPQAVAGWLAKGTTIQQQIDQAKEAREKALQPDVARKAKADADTAVSNATLAGAKAKLTTLSPDQWVSQIDDVAKGASPLYTTMAKKRIAFAAQSGDVEGAKKILDEAAEFTAAPLKAKSVEQAVGPLRTQEEIQKAAALAPIEENRALKVAGTNRAFSGADKLDAEYNSARTATEALGHMLDLAASGNKAAGSNLPLVGVETVNAINGIKRINSAEINQYGSAGSLLDEIKGKIGKLTSGQPIPADVLSDIRELHQALGEQSYEKYTSGLAALKKRSPPGTDLAPTLPPPNIRPAGAKAPPPGAKVQRNSATGQVRWSTDGGNTWQTQ